MQRFWKFNWHIFTWKEMLFIKNRRFKHFVKPSGNFFPVSSRCFDALFCFVLFFFAFAAKCGWINRDLSQSFLWIRRFKNSFATPNADVCVKIETYQFIQTCLVLSSISEIVTEMFFFAKARCETSSNRLDNRALFPSGINMRVSV